MILAGIDIGTNTFRLLIVDTEQGCSAPLHSDRKTVRLGEAVDRTGNLTQAAQERALAALAGFAADIDQFGAAATAAVGTSVLRRAANADSFLAEVKRTTGIRVVIVSGDDEARLTLLGVMASLNARLTGTGNNAGAKSLVVDIGGGSTEIIVAGAASSARSISLPLGAVYLTERFLRSDPPDDRGVERMRATIREELVRAHSALRPDRSLPCIGAAGTITTLAAIAQGLVPYESGKITGFVLEREFIDDIVARFGTMTTGQRKTVRGLDPERADIIFAGTVVLQELMDIFGYSSLLVSDWGLREGIVLDLAARTGAGSCSELRCH